MADQLTVVNSALEHIASQVQITSLSDGTPAAQAALVVYTPTVQILLRELDPDFARFTAALTASGLPPVPPWAFEYAYPPDMVRLRQVRPAMADYDVNDPQPVRANVGVNIVSGFPIKVILTNQANALAVYTTSAIDETIWDSVFTDAVVRRLANPLAMALSGRPDFAKTILEQSAMMAQTAEMVDDSGFRVGMRGT